jgi:hypothetical protein
MEAQHKQAIAKKYSGKIPSHELKSGLQITLVTRNDKDIGEVKVILHKQDPNIDPISRKETRDKVVKSLHAKISAGNSSHVLMWCVEADEYDVATDALSWQTILKSILHF